MDVAEKTKLENKMEKSIEAMQVELGRLRAGRANPSLVENLMVSVYGDRMPLNQLANISISDARTLMVTPWDKANTEAIEKAIMTSEYGLNPATSGQVIRIPLPPLSEERRRELIKIVKSVAETTKVSIRNLRRDVLADVKEQVKQKTLTEDDEHRVQTQVQKMTDDYVKRIDTIAADKENDLMRV